jgi:glutamyl/glutaminyl-tRNA synthetase
MTTLTQQLQQEVREEFDEMFTRTQKVQWANPDGEPSFFERKRHIMKVKDVETFLDQTVEKIVERVMDLKNPKTETNQEKVVRAFLKTDYDMCYSYSWFEFETKLDRKILEKEIKELKRLGYVEYHKGLLDDDGMAAGSGFGVAYSKTKEMEKLLSPTTKKEEE